MAEDKRPALPQPFAERMKAMLGDEYGDFLAAYTKERQYGLRFNPLKTDKETFLKRMPFVLEPVGWAEEGFYYRPEQQPGRHLFHEIGAYYIQEPSAMAVVEALAPQPGERILDLCAAPGGKSTQTAGKMRGEGLLVSNEYVPGRARILSQNIERMGIAGAVVCNETPERLAAFFPSFFDKILVDAPCSGEGMFRKDETAISEWSPEQVTLCAERQLSILEQAVQMLKPGGIFVYSTCTFSEEENEGVISRFLEKYPAFSIEHTMRLWPHKIKGEGHYIAKLKKAGTLVNDGNPKAGNGCMGHQEEKKRSGRKKEERISDSVELCRVFLREELGLTDTAYAELERNGVFMPFGEQVYLMPRQMIPLDGLKVIRPGLHLGTAKKNRFEPSHALALYLSGDMVRQHFEMTKEQAERYLRGETFACDDKLKGWMLLTIEGYAAGFGKAGNGQMKNHYPKGLRKMYS